MASSDDKSDTSRKEINENASPEDEKKEHSNGNSLSLRLSESEGQESLIERDPVRILTLSQDPIFVQETYEDDDDDGFIGPSQETGKPPFGLIPSTPTIDPDTESQQSQKLRKRVLSSEDENNQSKKARVVEEEEAAIVPESEQEGSERKTKASDEMEERSKNTDLGNVSHQSEDWKLQLDSSEVTQLEESHTEHQEKSLEEQNLSLQETAPAEPTEPIKFIIQCPEIASGEEITTPQEPEDVFERMKNLSKLPAVEEKESSSKPSEELSESGQLCESPQSLLKNITQADTDTDVAMLDKVIQHSNLSLQDSPISREKKVIGRRVPVLSQSPKKSKDKDHFPVPSTRPIAKTTSPVRGTSDSSSEPPPEKRRLGDTPLVMPYPVDSKRSKQTFPGKKTLIYRQIIEDVIELYDDDQLVRETREFKGVAKYFRQELSESEFNKLNKSPCYYETYLLSRCDSISSGEKADVSSCLSSNSSSLMSLPRSVSGGPSFLSSIISADSRLAGSDKTHSDIIFQPPVSESTRNSFVSRKKSPGKKPVRTKTAKTNNSVEVPMDIPQDSVEACRDIAQDESPRPSSPEIPLEMTESQVEDRKILPGLYVFALWKDGYYYPGTVCKNVSEKKYEIGFEDGFTAVIQEADILLITQLKEGQSVMVESSDQYYDQGIVQKFWRQENQPGYIVEIDSGNKKWYPKSKVILSKDQVEASELKSSGLSNPSLVTSDLNLCNIVDNKRRHLGKTESPVRRTPRRLKPDPNLDSSASTTQNSDTSTRGNKTPKTPREKSTSRGSTPRTSRTKVTPGKRETGTPKGKTVATSPRKGGAQKRKPVFKDVAFLLTKSDKRNLSHPDDEPIAQTYSKEETEMLIISHGGIILKTFDEAQTTKASRIYLISDRHLRTIKYIQCLASGIRCVSYLWIKNCIDLDIETDVSRYILPAGYSIVSKHVLEWHGSHKIFRGHHIILTSENEEFVETWTPVVLSADAEIVTKFVPEAPSPRYKVTYVISDPSCSESIVEKARQRNIPLVSSEWLIHCLIHGELLPVNMHPKFKYNYTGMKA